MTDLLYPSQKYSSPSPQMHSPSPTPTSPSSGGHWHRVVMQNSSSDCTELALARRWIEECTGCIEGQKGFREYLQDGTLLCELVQKVRPDLIKRIKRVKSPFAWRENVAFFLEACKSLGLKGSQLFSPEDLITSGARTPTTKTKGFRGENERKLRNVAITVFWLSRVIRTLPDYSGPLLDFDPSALGDWDHSEKIRSYTSPEPQQSPPHQNKDSPSSSSPSSSFPSLPSSPYHSPTIKVKHVEGTVSHTDQTSYPQVVVHVGRKCHKNQTPSSGPTHSRSNSLTDNRTFESSRTLQRGSKTTSTSALHVIESIFDPLSESERVLSNLTRELALTQKVLKEKQQTLSSPVKQLQNGNCAHTADRSQSPDIPHLVNGKEERDSGERESGESVTLQELIDAELKLNSHKSPLELHNLPHRSPSVTSSTPSEVSTIVPRDLVLSRCSGASFPEDVCITEQESVAAQGDLNPTAKCLTTETSDHPGNVSSSHPLSHSVSSQRPTQVVSEEPKVEVCDSQTLFGSSPLLDVGAVLSTHLSQSDTDKHNEPLEREEELLSFSADLTTSSGTHQRTHPTISSLKEDSRKSFYSSSSSLNSTACSVIEVSYCYCAESDAASSSHTRGHHPDTDADSASGYSSENENEAHNYEVVPEETLNHYLVDLEPPDLERTTALTRYHSLPNFEQVDLETIPEEMAVTAQVMRIYPAQSVGEISSSVSVPHHRVHIPSSSSSNGPESPSKCASSAATAVSATAVNPQEQNSRLAEEELSVKELAPGLMATAIQVLQDDEEEEDDLDDAEPVVTRNRKTSGGLASNAALNRMQLHVNLTVVPGLARVQSDALPLTLHADKLVVPAAEEGGNKRDNKESANLADLSDFNSLAVEIGSPMDSLSSSRVSLAASHQSSASLALSQRSVSSSAIGSQGELHAHIPRGDTRHHKQRSDDSFITSVLAPSHGGRVNETRGQGLTPVKSNRPVSAPVHATSDSVLPPNIPSPSASSHSSDSPRVFKMRNRRTSAEDQRQQRLANIAESTRAALTFTAIHRTKKTESLPRDSYRLKDLHNHMESKSVGSEEELVESSSTSGSSVHGKDADSSATAVDNVKMTDSGSPSPSFNLNNLSMDETRKASMTEMEEIWKLVENESGSSGSNTSVETAGGGGGGSGASIGRGLPSIALETHLSPQHVSSKQSKEREPQLDTTEETDGRIVENGQYNHTSLDVSEGEMCVDRVPLLSSTPKKPGDMSSATPNTAILNGKHKPTPVTKKDIDSLLTTLRSLSEVEEGEGRDEGMGLRLLEKMLHSNTFKRAQKVHDTVQQLVSHSEMAPKPVIKRVVPIAQEARHHFHNHTEPSAEVDELRALLREPHIQGLMFCHDRVSTEDYYLPRRHYPRTKQDPIDLILSGSVLNYEPTSSLDNSLPLSREIPSTRKEDATIIYLQRTNRPLGCTIYKQGEAVFVGKLLKGCDAELSEVLREGDELLEVNGVPVMGRSTDEIIRLMSGEAGVSLAFTIIPIHDDNVDLNYEPKYVRAHFNYNPKGDDEIPCQPLGLRFEKGDILEISNQDDPDWWQARKVFDDGAESLPGLIPARHRQQQREALTRSYPLAKVMQDQRKKKGLMSMLSRKKKKTVFYNQVQQHGVLAVGDEVVTYEDVVRMEPHPQWRRPVILIGASGVGKGTLIRKLINSDHTHFAAVVQHTTRAIHPGEVNGHTYHFVTREEFELDVLYERFLEHEEVKGHLYGTSVSATKKIVESGRVPVLDLQPHSLKRVRYCGLMPYIVFVASPKLERLLATRRGSSDRPRPRLNSSASSSFDMDSSHIDPELQHLLVESKLIDTQYSHYFDWIIVNDDLSVASDMLKEVARRAEEETQWVPASWMAEPSF